MPERPRPNLDRVRDALTERDDTVPEEPEPTTEEADEEEDDGDA